MKYTVTESNSMMDWFTSHQYSSYEEAKKAYDAINNKYSKVTIYDQNNKVVETKSI